MSRYPTAGSSSTSAEAPTDDKPEVTLETPRDPDRVSSFLNIRVKDIAAVYAEWSARGAEFLTEPKQHQYEIRCYIRDPDGHLIEVGQTTDLEGDWAPAHWPSSTSAEEFGRAERRVPQCRTPTMSPAMTTAIIGTGGIGSAIAARLASGGETLRLSSADRESARKLAAEIGDAALVAVDQPRRVAGRRCHRPRPAVYRARERHRRDGRLTRQTRSWSFPATRSASTQTATSYVCYRKGNPPATVVAGWLPTSARLAMAFGTMSAGLSSPPATAHRSQRSCST